MRIRLLFMTCIVAAATGCGSDKSTGPNLQPGTFQATTSGSTQGTFAGTAVWGQAQGLPNLEIVLADVTTHDSVFFVHPGTATLTPGTYPLADVTSFNTGATTVGIVELADPAVGQAPFVSTSGTLTITSSSTSDIQGSFQLVSNETLLGPTTSEFTISGSFDAKADSVPAFFSVHLAQPIEATTGPVPSTVGSRP